MSSATAWLVFVFIWILSFNTECAAADDVSSASPAQSNEIMIAPQMRACPEPAYPQQALRQCQEGTTAVSLLIDANGQIKESRIDESSGSPLLDQATIDHFSQCHFTPTTKNGAAVPSWIRTRIRWSLPNTHRACTSVVLEDAGPAAIRLEPLAASPPPGAEWRQVERSQYGITFMNTALGATAYVKLFPLAKVFSPEEFLNEVRKSLEAADSVGMSKTLEVTYKLTSERSYLCARVSRRRVDGVASSAVNANIRLEERMLICRSPERTDVGFMIAFSFPEGRGLDKAADEFISGVRYTGLSSYYLH